MSRLLRLGVLALAAFAVMPGTAMALDSDGSSAVAVRGGGPCLTGLPCPDPDPLCIDGPTGPICVLKAAISN